MESLDRGRAPEAVVGAERLQGAHLQGRPASRRRLPLRHDRARRQRRVGQVHLSPDRGAEKAGRHRLVFRSERRRDAAPRPRQLADGDALDGDLHRAGRQDQGQRAVDSRGFLDGGGAQDLRRRTRRHEAGLGRNHGPVRRISGTSEMKVEERDLVLIRIFDAPRERVWKAWTDPRQVAQWWGPAGFTNPRCEVDARPGGVLRIDMRGPDGTVYPMAGVYREVVAPERLVFTGSALDEKGKPLFEVLNTVTFAEQGGKTKLTVRAQVVKKIAAVADRYLKGQEQGWSQSLER